MRRRITFEFHFTRSLSELFRIAGDARRRIKLVHLSRQMKDSRTGLPVAFAYFPIAGQPAANTDDAPQTLRVREGEAIIQGARLREAKQKDALPQRDAFTDERFY